MKTTEAFICLWKKHVPVNRVIGSDCEENPGSKKAGHPCSGRAWV